MIEIRLTGTYLSSLHKLISHDETYREKVDVVVKLFSRKPDDSRLGMHALKRRLKGWYALEVDHDVRIIFRWIGNNRVRFLSIDKHSDVYRKVD